MERLKQQQQQHRTWQRKSRTILLLLLSLGILVSFNNQQHSFRSTTSGRRGDKSNSICSNSSSVRNLVFDGVVSFSCTFCFDSDTINSSRDEIVEVETQRNHHIETDDDDASDLKRRQDLLGCLSHEPIQINETQKVGADPSRTVLDHTNPITCGRLRRQWLSNPVRSDFAKKIQDHQSDCSLPLATHHFDNTFGMGSHLALWSQAMCNGMETGHRMVSLAHEWIWLDQFHCDMHPDGAQISPLLCYFPAAESLQCPSVILVDRDSTTQAPLIGDNHNSISETEISHKIWVDSTSTSTTNITDPRDTKQWCRLTKTSSPEIKAAYRASSTEYLFHKVSPLVIQEAQRQIGVIFPNGIVPEDIITVHIRWGDKFFEMDLPPISEYIDAIQNLTSHNNAKNNTTIYLATEDPKAYEEFMLAKPSGWTVYTDITLTEINSFRPVRGNRASWAARNTKGRAGLIALASILVAMEANRYVLTTKSNWSTLMNHLRMNIVDPKCGNCTKLVDLRPGLW
jgi:hypothetical protein